MTTAHARLAALTLALATSGCAASRTQVLVEVHSDLGAPEEIDRITLEARAPDGRAQSAEARLGPGELPLPRVLTMDHRSGELGPYTLTVRAERAGSRVVVQRQATFAFRSGQTLVLRVDLLRSCVEVDCGRGQTCATGGCRSVEVTPQELTPWNGAPYPLDAAAVDACTTERCNGLDDDCDGRVDEGFDRDSDPEHCGMCGIRCTAPNADSACQGGRCAIDRCQGSFADCDGDPRNGCETDLSRSSRNCGMCGNVCSSPNRDCCGGACGRC